jgi:hypothetical protein
MTGLIISVFSPAGIFFGCSLGAPIGSAELPPLPQLSQASQQSFLRHLLKRRWSRPPPQPLSQLSQQAGAGQQTGLGASQQVGSQPHLRLKRPENGCFFSQQGSQLSQQAGAGQQTGLGAGQQTGFGQQTGLGAGQQTGLGASQQAGSQQLLFMLSHQSRSRWPRVGLTLQHALQVSQQPGSPAASQADVSRMNVAFMIDSSLVSNWVGVGRGLPRAQAGAWSLIVRSPQSPGSFPKG